MYASEMLVLDRGTGGVVEGFDAEVQLSGFGIDTYSAW